MVIIYRSYLGDGGVETFIMRLVKWFTERDENICVVSRGGWDSQSEGIIEYLDTHHIPRFLNYDCSRKWIECNLLNEEIRFKKEVLLFTIATLQYDAFLFAEKIINLIPQAKYMNFPLDVLEDNKTITRKIHRAFDQLFFRKTIQKFIQKNQMVFLDDYKSIEKYFDIKIDGKYCYRIPMFINRYNEDIVFKRCELSAFRIFTCARADFPFKGYILGLIDLFNRLHIRLPKLELRIVSTGKDVKKIKEKIEQLPKSAKGRIDFIEGVNYNELHELMKDCKLFVGMGTSCLDAANSLLPIIYIKPYEYKALSTGIWDYESNIDFDLANEKNTEEAIVETYEMSKDVYHMMAEKKYKAFSKNYNIDSIMPRILERMNNMNNFNTSIKLLFILDEINSYMRYKKRRNRID